MTSNIQERVGIRRYNFNEEKFERFYDIADQSFFFGSPWTIEQFQETLAREDLVFFVAEIRGHLIGYIGGRIVLDEAEIYTVVVSKEYQKQKVAHYLLKRFKEECRARNVKAVFLEVRESNVAAMSFYLKNQFEVVSVRKNYYTDPQEDGLIMKSKSGEKEEDGKETNPGD